MRIADQVRQAPAARAAPMLSAMLRSMRAADGSHTFGVRVLAALVALGLLLAAAPLLVPILAWLLDIVA